MKPYGMLRMEHGDTDVAGCLENGRATRIYSLSGRAYRGLRNGKKAAVRRIHKRRARREGKAEAQLEEWYFNLFVWGDAE